MFTHHDYFRFELAKALGPVIEKTFHISFSVEKIYGLFTQTPSKEAGDLAFPLFMVAKEAKTNPALAAKTLDEALHDLPDFIQTKKSMGPYLNFFYNFNLVSKKGGVSACLMPSTLSITVFIFWGLLSFHAGSLISLVDEAL